MCILTRVIRAGRELLAFGAFEMKLCVESFQMMEKTVFCHYYCYDWFWLKGFLCLHRSTVEDQFLLPRFMLKSKGKIQMSWNLASSGTYRVKHLSLAVHTYIWAGNSPAPLHCQGAKIHHAAHLHMLRNTPACIDHILILPLFICIL